MNKMDAHLFTDLGMEHYRGAVDRVELLEAALKDVEQSEKMVHHFLCPYCHGPLAGVIAVKERGR